MATWIPDLSRTDFKSRESATVELKRVVEVTRPLLVEARKTSTSAGPNSGLANCSITLHPPMRYLDYARWRCWSVSARTGRVTHCKVLAGGSPDVELTSEARAALERFGN